MKRIAGFFTIALFATSLAGGCIIHNKKPGTRTAAAKKKDCHPSQYWDGEKCRHKGKGHGARKHDGKRK